MALTADKKSRIQEIVKGILERRIETFPADASLNRNAPFHDAFLSAFREQLKAVAVPTPYLVAIASWMHGLNTSMGTGFENIAHVLSGGYKKSFARGFRLKISSVQSARISAITVGLASGAIRPNRIEEDKLIMSDVKAGEPLQDALEFTADVYLESADAVECIELKSVRPNKGEGRGEKEKILHGKAALKRLHSKKTISFLLVFRLIRRHRRRQNTTRVDSFVT